MTRACSVPPLHYTQAHTGSSLNEGRAQACRPPCLKMNDGSSMGCCQLDFSSSHSMHSAYVDASPTPTMIIEAQAARHSTTIIPCICVSGPSLQVCTFLVPPSSPAAAAPSRAAAGGSHALPPCTFLLCPVSRTPPTPLTLVPPPTPSPAPAPAPTPAAASTGGSSPGDRICTWCKDATLKML
jgi:hypothetical protein